MIEDVGRLEQQYQDQQVEGYYVFVLVVEYVGVEGFGDVQQQVVEYGVGDVVDVVEYCGGECFDFGEEVDFGVDYVVLYVQQYCGDGGQGGVDDEGEGDDVVVVDIQQVGYFQVFGVGVVGVVQVGVGDEQGEVEYYQEGDDEDQDLYIGDYYVVYVVFVEYEVVGQQGWDGFFFGVL